MTPIRQLLRARSVPTHAPAHLLLRAAVLACLLSPLLLAQSSVTPEFRAKANFLTNFPSFVDWPDTAFASQQAPLLICIIGDFRFGTALAEVARSASPHGRRLEVRWIHRDEDLRACQVIFVSRSESKRYVKLLQSIEPTSALTVGETPDFLDAGGMINFDLDRETVQFEVNLSAADNARLKISSRLLALAKRVVRKAEPEKS